MMEFFDQLYSYDIAGIHAPIFVGIVSVAVIGFILMRLFGLRRESGMWIALAILVLVLSWSNERFINLSDPSNAADLIRLTSMLGIYSIGLAFVIITGGIDLSVGSIIGLTGVIIAKVILPAAITDSGKAPPTFQWGLIAGLVLLLIICLAWMAGERRTALAAIVLLVYAALAAGAVALSITDAGTGVGWIDAILSGWATLGGGGAGMLDAICRGTVLLIGIGVGLSALLQRNTRALGAAAGILLAYHLYAILILAFAGGQPIWLAILVALAAATAVGLAQGMLLTKLGLQPFIVTLGVMLLIRGVSQTIVEGGTLSIKDKGLLALANGGLFYVGEPGREVALLPYPLLIFLGVLILGTYLLHFTVLGRYIYAIGGNRDAAEYSGLPVKRIEATTYVISAFLGGVAGVCYASYIGQMSQQVGIAYELSAIAACVLGGCSLRGGEGTILGVVIGTAVMRVIENGIIMFQLRYQDAMGNEKIWKLNTNWTFVIIGAVILIAIVVDQLVHMFQARRRTRRAGAAA